MVSLVDDIVLLAYDDATGRSRVGHLEFGIAGAALLELVLAERVSLTDGKISVDDRAPIGQAVPDAALAALAADKPRKPKAVVQRLARGVKRRALDDLAARGLMRVQHDRVLGLFPLRRYIPGAAGAKTDARFRLASAVDLGRAPDARTAALGSIVYALNMERVVFPDRQKSQVRKVLKNFSEGSWASEATRGAIQAAQAAVMAAVTAAAAAAASSSSGS
ncbi:GPP34 family phosphoprotein [Glycomyces sp. NPDC046736]|uniref:GOLPH3/VPS74 family protein n=1 Tax=Glycomyces sp. NPDC046736 TaxID=3155615 RepID=UPI003408B7B1